MVMYAVNGSVTAPLLACLLSTGVNVILVFSQLAYLRARILAANLLSKNIFLNELYENRIKCLKLSSRNCCGVVWCA